MLRPFFYNARTRGPTLARDIIFLVKPDHLALEAELTVGPLALSIFRQFWIYFYTNVWSDFRRTTGKLHEMCIRTPSTSFKSGRIELINTYGVA